MSVYLSPSSRTPVPCRLEVEAQTRLQRNQVSSCWRLLSFCACSAEHLLRTSTPPLSRHCPSTRPFIHIHPSNIFPAGRLYPLLFQMSRSTLAVGALGPFFRHMRAWQCCAWCNICSPLRAASLRWPFLPLGWVKTRETIQTHLVLLHSNFKTSCLCRNVESNSPLTRTGLFVSRGGGAYCSY